MIIKTGLDTILILAKFGQIDRLAFQCSLYDQSSWWSLEGQGVTYDFGSEKHYCRAILQLENEIFRKWGQKV